MEIKPLNAVHLTELLKEAREESKTINVLIKEEFDSPFRLLISVGNRLDLHRPDTEQLILHADDKPSMAASASLHPNRSSRKPMASILPFHNPNPLRRSPHDILHNIPKINLAKNRNKA